MLLQTQRFAVLGPALYVLPNLERDVFNTVASVFLPVPLGEALVSDFIGGAGESKGTIPPKIERHGSEHV
jgi:hypothetical protein